jgi:dTDP-glucose 4,6-dehydratase
VDLSYARKGQDIRYSLNDEKIRKLGWKPNKIFDEEIEKIVFYYKEKFRW